MLKCFHKEKRKRQRSFMLRIVDIKPDFVVVEKPCGMPSQSDPSGDTDAMSETSRLLSEMGVASELWLVHRLDRVVAGLIVFARNKRAAAGLSEQFSGHDAGKIYLAVTEGEAEEGELCDLLYKDANKGKSFVVDRMRAGVKEARLVSERLSLVESCEATRTLLRVTLKTGRFHQIRAQLSSRATPLVGDKKYGSRDTVARFPALFSHRIAFRLFGREYSYIALPDTESYPWSLFNLTEILK